MALAGHATLPNVQGLPATGAAGQVLAKNSALDYDVTWASLANPGSGTHGPLVSTYWYSNIPVAGQINLSNYNVTTNTGYYMPVWFDFATTITALGVRVVSPSGTPVVVLGILRASTTTGMPTTLLGSVSASVASASTQSLTLSSPVVTGTGWNYLFIGCSTGTQWIALASNTAGTARSPFGMTAANYSSGNTTFFSVGAGTPSSNPTGLTAQTSEPPVCWFRVG